MYFDQSRSLAPVGLGRRIGQVLFAGADSMAAWNDTRLTRKSLSHLTDRELDDIGLSRADIELIARGR